MGKVTPEWLAGFFDGEGTVDIRIAKTHGGKYMRFELRVQIAQRDRAPLRLIQAEYGGSIQGRRCGLWVASGSTALAFLRAIFPHSVCKADQIAVGIRFQERLVGMADRMVASRRRGFWKLPQDEMDARLALHREIRAIRDASGLRPKARNNSLQAEAAVYAVSRDGEAVANHRGAQASGKDRGLH